MVLFPEQFVTVLVWGCLGLSFFSVLLLATLWIKDIIKGKLW